MKSLKKALAVLLSVLMVAFSFPLSALAVENPNNAGYASGEEPFSTDYDVELHAFVMDYDGYDSYGFFSSTAGKELDPTSLSKENLASEDGVFCIYFTITGLDLVSSWQLTMDYDNSILTPAEYGRRDALTTGNSVPVLEDITMYKDGSSDGGYTMALHNKPQIYFAAAMGSDTDNFDDETIVDTGCVLPGQVVGCVGFQLLTDETVDLTKVIRLQNDNVGCQIETVFGINEEKYIVGYGATLAIDYPKWIGGPYYTGEPSPQTQFTWAEWGYAPAETSTDVTYTYHFANGDTTEVTAEAGVAPQAPANTAATTPTSNNDGTHTYNTYSWPEWVDGTTEYTEVATPVTEDCAMEETSPAVAPTHTTAGKTAVETCSVCGYQTGGVEVPAEGHTWVEESRTPATCVATGEVKYTCSCGETMTETLPIDPENHADVVTDAAVAATCTKTGLTEGSHCADCDTVIVAQEVTPVDLSNHTNVVTDAAKAATCTEAGITEGSHCEDCGTVIVAQETIDALGHDYQITASTDATCVTPGSVTYTCTRCGDSYTDEGVLNPENHEGETISADNAVAPTRGEAGKEADKICSACHAVVEEGAVIPALGVQITVEQNELGTTTLNGEATTGAAQKVAYKDNYTLTATPNEGVEFVGWQVNGKLVSTNATYTTAAYADLTYVPVFAEKTNDFTVTFVDQFNMVLGTYTSAQVAELEAMPSTYNYLGYTFADWSMTLEEVKALDANAIVTANYTKNDTLTYTVSAPGCTITVGGEVYNDAAEVGFDQAVTVAPAEGTATAWTVNGNDAAYGSEYTFYVTSDVEVAYTSDDITAVPTVAGVDVAAVGDGNVRFLATRNVPADYTLLESGFVYGKDYPNAEESLVLENANSTCYIYKNSNTANDGQFALTFKIASETGVAYARAYVIAADAEGNAAVYYGNVQSFDYGA